MNATRILPDLQSSLLCEDVRQEANGNFFIIGVVNFLRVPQLPVCRRAALHVFIIAGLQALDVLSKPFA